MVQYGRDNLLKVVGDDPSEWCEYEPPMAYGYIQKVGALTAAQHEDNCAGAGVLGQRVPALLGGQAAAQLRAGDPGGGDGAAPLLPLPRHPLGLRQEARPRGQ